MTGAPSRRLLHGAAVLWVGLVLINYAARAAWPEFTPLSLAREALAVSSWEWSPGLARLGHGAGAFVTALLVAAAALGMGDAGVRWLMPEARTSLALAWTAGLGMLGTIWLGAGFGGLMRGPVFIAVVVAAGTAGAVRMAAGIRHEPKRPVEPLLQALGWLAAAAAAGWFLSALAPETEMDSLKYHLGKAQQFLLAGRITSNLSVFFKFPSLWEALLAMPLALGGESAAKLVQPLVILLIAALLHDALATSSPFGGRLAAGLWLTSYAVGRLAVTAKNDVFVAALVLGGFRCWLGTGGRTGAAGRRLPAAGVFLGCALAVKYTAALAVGMLTVLEISRMVRRPVARSIVTPLLMLGAGAVAGYAPWGLRNWLETGNPFFPVAAGVFHAGLSPTSWGLMTAETHWYVNASYASLPDKARAIWNLAVVERLWLLPALAVPGLAVLARRRSPGLPWLAGGALLIAFWTAGPPQPRYLLQGLTLLCASVEWSAAAFAAGAAGRRAVLGLVLVVAAIDTGRGWGDYWSDRGSRIPVALGLLDPDAYALDKLTTYTEAVTWMNERLPLNAHVLIFGPTRTFPLARRSTLRTEYEPVPPLALAADADTDARFAIRMRQAGFTHLFYNRLNAVGWGEQLAALLPPERALGRWTRWWRVHATLIHESPRFDLRQGVYEVFDLDGRPAPGRPPLLLPGVEGWLFPPAEFLRRGESASARGWFERVRAVAGDIPFVRQAEVAMFESSMSRAAAWRILREVDATGFRSVWLLTTLGRYAAEAGDPAGAAAYRLRADALAFREGAAPEGGGLLPHPVAHQLWETP